MTPKSSCLKNRALFGGCRFRLPVLDFFNVVLSVTGNTGRFLVMQRKEPVMSSVRRTNRLLAVSLLLLLPASALALDTAIVGPRALGMAGANVASVDNNAAQYYNPAAFGFFGQLEKGKRGHADTGDLGRKDWGVDIYAGGGYRLNNDMGQYLDDIAAIDYKALSQNGIQTESDLADLLNLVSDLNGLDQPGTAITGDVNGGLSLRVKHFGIGVRGYTQAAGQVIEIDTTNISVSSNNLATDNLATDIGTVTVNGFVADGLYTYFTTAQANALIARLQTQFNATLADAQLAVEKLDYMASQQGIDPNLSQNVTDTLTNLAPSTGTGGGSFDNNTTTVLLTGFGVAEVPLTYGFALNEHFSLGANLKWMRGRVYGNEVLVFDNNSSDTLSNSDENYEESDAFGLDLGLLARFGLFNVGVTGRNLNAPEFDGFTKTVLLSNGNTVTIDAPAVTIDPQVTAGVAFLPHPTLTFEVDYDLTRNETILRDYHTQNLALGLEWDAFRFLALRLGAYKNLAEDDIDWVYTAGLGLNLWALRIDVAGAMAEEKVQYDGEDTPVESKVAAQISVDF